MSDEQQQSIDEQELPQTVQGEQEESADYKAQWMRAQADYQNLQKEVSQQRAEWAKLSTIRVLEDIIPVVENFKKAFAHETTNDPASMENWKKGIGFIQKQLEDVMQQYGVETILTVGQTFDPTLHEAVGEEEQEGIESGVIIKEVAGGYKSGDHIIMPAKVIITP